VADPYPHPSPSPSGEPATQIVHSVWHGLLSAAESSPWVVALLAILVAVSITRSVRDLIHSGPRDPVRCFPRADKAIILARAGGRCEHHSPLFGRCRATERLEADHVHPHSKGGWTHVANGQALCHSHNHAKRAAIPWNRQLRALERRRQTYFPAGYDWIVVRRPTGSRVTGRTPARAVARRPGR
jgi:hypothetical protein